MAVSAVTADTLQNTGATDIRQLNQLSPSLLVSSTTSEAGAAVARIRGIGTVGDNPGLEGSVATYIDGVYRSRTGVALTELGPLDRIEVLRGPQGTLFGRNASAGVISVITAKPQFTPAVSGAGRASAITTIAGSRRRQRPARRNRRRPPRRRLCEARRLPQGRDLGPPSQRSRPLAAARADCCSSRATIFRSA